MHENVFDKSVYGVKSMAGNTREWCLDLYQADKYPIEEENHDSLGLRNFGQPDFAAHAAVALAMPRVAPEALTAIGGFLCAPMWAADSAWRVPGPRPPPARSSMKISLRHMHWPEKPALLDLVRTNQPKPQLDVESW